MPTLGLWQHLCKPTLRQKHLSLMPVKMTLPARGTVLPIGEAAWLPGGAILPTKAQVQAIADIRCGDKAQDTRPLAPGCAQRALSGAAWAGEEERLPVARAAHGLCPTWPIVSASGRNQGAEASASATIELHELHSPHAHDETSSSRDARVAHQVCGGGSRDAPKTAEI